jgi:hypothetical protein
LCIWQQLLPLGDIMATAALTEYDAEDVDVRVLGLVAVLVMSTDKGRVAVSLTPETLERLALRIQLEQARAFSITTRPSSRDAQVRRL